MPAAHVICMDDVYGGTYRLFERVRRRSAGLDFSFVDLNDLAALEAALQPNTKMIWCETPTNPLLKTGRHRAPVRVRQASMACCWRSTTPSARRSCSGRWSWAPIW